MTDVSEFGQAAETQTLDQHEILALFLLYEYHEPEGPWSPYLCMLPRKLTSTIFWPPDLLQQLPREGPLVQILKLFLHMDFIR